MNDVRLIILNAKNEELLNLKINRNLGHQIYIDEPWLVKSELHQLFGLELANIDFVNGFVNRAT